MCELQRQFSLVPASQAVIGQNVPSPTQQQHEVDNRQHDSEEYNTLKVKLGSLVIDGNSLKVDIPTAKKPGWLFSANSVPWNNVALHDVLGASTIDDVVTIDHVVKNSNNHLEFKSQRFQLSNHSSYRILPSTWVEVLLSKAYGSAQPRRRAYVLINPHSGRRQALRIWERDVRPLFDAAHWSLSVKHTECRGHAVKLAEDLDIEEYDVIVTCSGDGIPHEVFNGLARRPDAGYALSKIAIAHVPCGGGNALAVNLYGTDKPTVAALAILKGERTRLDLASITQGGKRTVSFLSQALGVIAEIGRATEHLRWMGESRLTYGYLRRVLARKIYPCDISIKIEMQDKKNMLEHYLIEKNGGIVKKAKTEPSIYTQEAIAGKDPLGLPPLMYGTVDDPVPEDWVMIKYDNMGNFYAGNVCHDH